ncbi:MAG: hypothetical protein HRT38_18605 [Alteromonadaceae bacterium]|nr:hypothetical protein [Alteromonadaceae bacterium]
MQFQTLHLPYLEDIIKESQERLAKTDILDLTESNLWYPDELPNLPILEKVLKELNLVEHVHRVAMHVTMPGVTIPVHLDTGPFNWSLNIPVQSFDDSFVALYETDELPELLHLPNDVSYMGYRSEDKMRPHTKIPSHQPLLLNVKKPHNVINSSDRVRVMMLIRLNRSFNIEAFIKENQSMKLKAS